MDWKSQLEALKTDLPEGENTPVAAEQDASAESSVQKERLDIILDKKGRKGKAATIIAGFVIADEEVEALASKLKQRLGAGGSARGGEILIQGDKRSEALRALEQLGFKARII